MLDSSQRAAVDLKRKTDFRFKGVLERNAGTGSIKAGDEKKVGLGVALGF